MHRGDPLPIALTATKANVTIDAVTSERVTAWVAACRAMGFQAVDGNELAAAQKPLLRDFLGFG